MRQDFTKATKRIIAGMAGHQCSYLTCTIRTSAPDLDGGAMHQAGVAAHIYSASPSGPRGQGGLTQQELMHHDNGIWLCKLHASVIDDNNGIGHPAELLLSYKRLHEHRVQKEVLGLCSTIGWIDEFEISQSPLFSPGVKVKLGKLNLLFGDNAVGKTTFGRYLGGVFDPDRLDHWYAPGKIDLDFRVSFFSPEPVSIKFSVSNDYKVRYELNGSVFSKIPISLRVIIVPEFSVNTEGNDKAFIAQTLRMPEWQIEELIGDVNAFPHSNLRNYRFVNDEENGGNTLHVEVRKSDYPERVFEALSSTEQKMAFIDFATAAARRSSKITPTLLVLDCNLSDDVERFKKLEPQLLAPGNHFQTILTMRLDSMDVTEGQWRGWHVTRLYREDESLTQFSQDPNMKIVSLPWEYYFEKSERRLSKFQPLDLQQ